MERSTDWVKKFLPFVGRGGVLVDFFQILRSPDDFPLFIFGAELPGYLSQKLAEGKKRLPACGANLIREKAMASALAEGIERYAFITWDTESKVSVMPQENYTSMDFLSLPFLINQKDKPDRFLKYVLEKNDLYMCYPDVVSRGKSCPVPISMLSCLNPTDWPQTSNGMACGNSFENACLHALYELIERDTLMLAWFHNIHGCLIRKEKFLSPLLIDRLFRHWEKDVELIIRAFMTDIEVPVFLSAFIKGGIESPQGIALGAAASLNPIEAAERSLNEAVMAWQGIRSQVMRHTAVEFNKNSTPTNFADHLLLYQLPEMAITVCKWLKSINEIPFEIREIKDNSLQMVVGKLHSAGYKAMFFDMTPQEIEGIGIKVARAIVPGLVPLSIGNWHGSHLPRYKNPPEFRLGSNLNRKRKINLLPHPFP